MKIVLRKAVESMLVLSFLLILVTGCEQKGTQVKTTADPVPDVKPVISAEEAAARINNDSEYEPAELKTEKHMIYTATSDWQYAHHPHIAYFDGRFYAIFSAAPVNEEDPGQRIMLSASEDGENWSEAIVLVEPEEVDGVAQVLMPCGFYTYGDKLKVYYSSFEWSKESLQEGNLRPLAEDGKLTLKGYGLISTKDGNKWEKEEISCAAGGNFGPIEAAGGRLIMAGASTHAYTDELSGNHWKFGVVDTVPALSTGGAEIITEGSFYQTEDGIIHMMQRSNTRHLYCAESYDNGETYTAAYRTGFTDDYSKFRFGKLPDGRYFYVGNCEYTGGSRDKLYLCISEDGVNFDKWYLLRDEYTSRRFTDGLYKSGIYAYPSICIKDDTFYVIYSKCKESIEVTSFALTELDNVTFVKKTPVEEIFKTNLMGWRALNGVWTYEENLGYLITPEKKAVYISMSDTKTEPGQSFIYEADATVLSDYSECFFSLVFGATSNAEQTQDFSKETYYELRMELSHSFSRIFTIQNNEMWRRGWNVELTDEQLAADSFHIKLVMDGSENMASYYINGEFINKVYLEEFSGGYMGLLSYNGGIVFNNVTLTLEE